MKKVRLVPMILGSALLLTACGNKQNDAQPSTTNTNALPITQTAMDCAEAIQNYLSNADLQWNGAEIQTNDAIVVNYIGRLNDHEVFDTSIESIAQACWVYNPARNYEEGLPFTVGAGQMIAGFDAAVVGMKLGQTKTITIPAKDAYGERSEEYIQTFPLSEVPNPEQFHEGMQISLGYGMNAIVTKITDKEITLDMNHELAGKDLIFDITIKSIN